MDGSPGDGSMFFDGWPGLGRTALVALCAYAALVLFLRTSGKRTLSKMNAFDFVVTVALGSTLASVITSRSIPLADGLLALAMLIVLQLVVTWLSIRVAWFQSIVKAEPTLLFHRGRFLDHALQRQRVTKDEVFAALRADGQLDLDDVEAVVLETDGSFSVVGRKNGPTRRSTLRTVNAPQTRAESSGEDSASAARRT